jgi:hypothetical protein
MVLSKVLFVSTHPTILYFYDPLQVINIEFPGHAAMPHHSHCLGRWIDSVDEISIVEFPSSSLKCYRFSPNLSLSIQVNVRIKLSIIFSPPPLSLLETCVLMALLASPLFRQHPIDHKLNCISFLTC